MLKKPTKTPYANFKLYYAAIRTRYVEDYMAECNYYRLLSYVNERSEIEKQCKNGRQRLFVDSGAFSAATRGIQISVDDYIDWLNKWSTGMEKFCSWDVIPVGDINPKDSAKQSWENYLYMYERVNEPEKLVYVYHNGEPIEYLESAIEFGCKKIALGGIAKASTPVRRAFFESVKETLEAHPEIDVHAFGMTSIDLLKEYTFINSGDSTTWLWALKFSEAQFDTVPKVYFSDANTTKKNHVNNITDEQFFGIEDELREFGFEVEDLYGNGDGNRNREVYQVVYWQKKFFAVNGGYYIDNETGDVIEVDTNGRTVETNCIR